MRAAVGMALVGVAVVACLARRRGVEPECPRPLDRRYDEFHYDTLAQLAAQARQLAGFDRRLAEVERDRYQSLGESL